MHPNIIGLGQRTTGSVQVAPVGTIGRVWSVTMSLHTDYNTIQIKDGTVAGGTVIFSASAAGVLASGDETKHYIFPGGLSFTNGLALVRINTIPNMNITYSIDKRA